MIKKTFLLSVFLLTTGCSTFGSVDYQKIESFNVVLRDVNGQILNCKYQRGFNVNCIKETDNETQNETK